MLVSETKKMESHLDSLDLSVLTYTNLCFGMPYTNNNMNKINHLSVILANLLIEAGCNMNKQDYPSQESPAFKAIVKNNFELVKLFVVEGLDISLRNNFGNDILSRSIQLGRFKIARLLVVADSPIRVYSCFYKVPHNIIFSNNSNRYHTSHYFEQFEYGDEISEIQSINSRENFLHYSINRFEEFLLFLKKYTQEPRSLIDLARLNVRKNMKKPVSKNLLHLGNLPNEVKRLILLEDIDKKI